jgi:hypothetical protein
VAGTLTIPLTTLAVGAHTFPPAGGASVADGDSLVRLSIDRTVKNGSVQGFNGQPATTTALIYAYQSNDGGATWKWIAGDQVTGGIYTSPKTGQENTDYVEVGLDPGTGRLVRATVTVSGAAVAVAGALTTS